jgi:L-fucose isomerase-like protein
MFGFVPCYVNSRLTGRGIPVACEVDIYGALSEYIGTCISQDAVTLLDINNTVPTDMYEESIKGKKFACDTYTEKEIFMGFHCGNTASSKVCNCQMCFQRIMARALPVEVTNGTLEGDIQPGLATVYRLQSTADTKLRAYIAQGEVIPVATRSFGSIGIFGIKNMSRFYRHVLIEKHYPHHCAVMFGHQGKYLWEVLKYMGIPVDEIDYNFPKGNFYPTENPFA